jgi:hypothetical protein
MPAIMPLPLVALLGALIPATGLHGEPVPDIDLVPDSLTYTLAAGDTAWSHFTIRNLGDAPLQFRLGILTDELPIVSPPLPQPPSPPISVQPREGQVPPGGEQEIGVRFDARTLSPAFPFGVFVIVDSNDPDERSVPYVIILNVLPYVPLLAELSLKPSHLDVARGGPWLTASIELPAAFDPSEILVETVRLQGVAPAPGERASIRDPDHDGLDELKLRFDRASVAAAAGPDGVLEVTGFLRGGRPFSGQAVTAAGSRRFAPRRPLPVNRFAVPTTWSGVKLLFR